MRQLTFRGFTKQYVSELSISHTTAIYTLVQEMCDGNLRLNGPLFLYAVSNGHMDTLLKAARDTRFFAQYAALADTYHYQEIVAALEESSPRLPREYHKVWQSYTSVAHRAERDERVKMLYREKILVKQQATGITTYRLSKELQINNANVNAWLKDGLPNKVSLDLARKMYEYLNEL